MVVVFGVGHCGGYGFLFLGCDQCLKGLWVVVGFGVWVVVVGLWLRWVVAEVGHWSWIGG